MSFTLNPHILTLFYELRELSQASIKDFSFNDRENAISDLNDLFTGLAFIFDDIDDYPELFTPTTLELMQQEDALIDHEYYFEQILPLFSDGTHKERAFQILSELKVFYLELRDKYYAIISQIEPAKGRSIKQLLESLILLKAYVVESVTPFSYHLFLHQLDTVIQFFKAIEKDNYNLQPLPDFNIHENLNILILHAPSLVQEDLESIKLHLLLNYEYLVWKKEQESQEMKSEPNLNLTQCFAIGSVIVLPVLYLFMFASNLFSQTSIDTEDSQENDICPAF